MPRRPRLAADNRTIALVGLIVLVLFVLWLFEPRPAPPALPQPGATTRTTTQAPPAATPEGYLFCTWNVENLFDDEDDPRNHDEDEDWFARDRAALRLKLDNLADALLRQNGGRGPDILAIVEVESRRAAELLREALNARLPSDLRYENLIHHDNKTGRRIEPAVLTRLRVRPAKTRTFGIRRMLEAHLEAEGAPLVVLVSHWTSRVTDETDVKRSAYADAVYRAFLDHHRADPAADVLICGDFNDEPDDTALVDHLRVTADPGLVRLGDDHPRLLDLVMGKDARRDGTYFYGGRWQFLDHVVCSPGLLDPSGWQVLPETTRTVNDFPLRSNTDRRPHRFGGPKTQTPRGTSDHFALTVRLRVRPGGPAS